MKAVIIGLSLATAFGSAKQLNVDPARLGDSQATLGIEAPELAGYKTIPLLQSKWVTVTLSSYPGCPVEPNQSPKLTPLGVGVLTPKQNRQTAAIPGDADLAIFAESTEQGGGNSVSCTAALRFHSEAGKRYVVRYAPPRAWHKVSCSVEVVELRDGQESPVPSAHGALTNPVGLLKGGDLNICAESGKPASAAP